MHQAEIFFAGGEKGRDTSLDPWFPPFREPHTPFQGTRFRFKKGDTLLKAYVVYESAPTVVCLQLFHTPYLTVKFALKPEGDI